MVEMNSHYAYSHWDGTQQLFNLDESELMEEMADDLINHGDVRRALRELMQRGTHNRDGEQVPGLRDLMDRLNRKRQQQLERYHLDSVVDDLKKKLATVLQTERQGIDRRVQEAQEQLKGAPLQDQEHLQQMMDLLKQRSANNREKLDVLPESLGGAVRGLQDYDFIDPDAQRQFQELMGLLRQQMMGNVAQDMKERIQQMGPQEMVELREMMRDLNELIRDKLSGLEPDFEGFMDQWGKMFGSNPPGSFDELMEMMAQQMGQMQSLLNSMSPDQRRELSEAMNAALDEETADELHALAMNLGELIPWDEWRDEYPFFGDEDLTLDQAMDLMGELQSMDDLEHQIQEAMRRGDIGDINAEELERLLGEEARRDLGRLDQIAKQLEDAGYLRRKGDDLELTPAGIRKIGNKALKELFSDLRKGRLGSHDLHSRGSGGEHTDETKNYEFGDPFVVDLQKTVMNGVLREGPGTPVKLRVEDFEVKRTEHMTQAATVLLLDQSRSMGLFGSFFAAKKVAMALNALVQSKFPRDQFFIIGFSDMAVPIKNEELPETTWNVWVSGTNMQHAFMMSRKLLSRYKDVTKQIIMITDGEPTAYIENGHPFFSYPPSFRTIQETLKEVKRCTQEGIIINTFMLETSHYLLDFVDQLTRINRGRALYTTPDQLGQYVVVDYLTNRKRRVRS
jgi:uncharacterized protein with von Willebrand factor type A (vWA) domain